jgi:hypothetical protein
MVTEIQLFEFTNLTLLDFCLCSWTKSDFTREGWVDEMNYSLEFFMLLPAKQSANINSDEQQAVFAQELKSTLSLTVVQGWAMKRENFKNIKKKLTHEFFLSVYWS